MIYYCTKDQNRLQPQEIELINTLRKIYDFERVPLIIIHTLSNSEHFYLQFKESVQNKFGVKYPIIRMLARDLDGEKAYGMEDLKRETKKKRENICESAYISKFIANISKNLYKEYTDNIFITTIKGFFNTSKEDSIDDMFNKIFNMYRFNKSNTSFNDEQKSKLNEFKTIIIQNYDYNIDDFIRMVIKYNSKSDVYNEDKDMNYTLEEREERIEELYEEKLNNQKEYNSFKKDIDNLLFPCLIEVLKAKIITYFNEKIMIYLRPKIEEILAH